MMLQRRSLSRLRTFRHIVCRAISVRDVAAVHRKQGPLLWLCESRVGAQCGFRCIVVGLGRLRRQAGLRDSRPDAT
jgi:hypothetical protein